MHLHVRDVARLFQVTEKTVYGWIRNGSIPNTRIHDRYRFNAPELLEWATANHMPVPPELLQNDIPAPSTESVADAIEAGGVHYGLRGTDKSAVLREVVQRIPFPADTDREMFLRMVLAREEMASTGIGDGIAIPHVRNPLVLHVKHPIITLCFLEAPIDFGAIDGKPVHSLFTLVSPNMRLHLHVISRLAFALHDPQVSNAVISHAPQPEIISAIRRVESGMNQ